MSVARIEKARRCWDLSRNGFEFDINSIDRSIAYYYKCDNLECNHVMLLNLNGIKQGRWCNHKSFKKGYLCDNNDISVDNYCNICYNGSFAASPHVHRWSENNTHIVNGEVVPLLARQVTKHENKTKRLLKCAECNHDNEVQLNNVSSGKGCNCPYCGSDKVKGRIVCGDLNCNFCLVKTLLYNYPKISELWIREKNIISNENNEVTYLEPHMVTQLSHIICWIKCKNINCNHIHDTEVKNIVSNAGCKYCNGIEVCGGLNCNNCYIKSFAKHYRSKFFNYKLNILIPLQIRIQSNKVCYFNCDKCYHTFDMKICSITGNEQQWCPYCSNSRLCGTYDCKTCFEKSLASYPISLIYSKTKNIDGNSKYIHPLTIFKGSSETRWFKCYKCDHYVNPVVRSNLGNKLCCVYCSGQQRCEDTDCDWCSNRRLSTVHPDKARYWCYGKNIGITPDMISFGSNIKRWFHCINCDTDFKITPKKINIGQWCICYVNKTEHILYMQLRRIYSSLERQFTADWCKNIKHLPFDFIIPEYNIIIELDGTFHYKDVNFYDTNLKETQKWDIYKQRCANKNGYSTIRLTQEDVYHNKFDWIDRIIKSVDKIIAKNKVQNIYICEKNEYDYFTIRTIRVKKQKK
jgi:very-short-patch-repair endonuclease